MAFLIVRTLLTVLRMMGSTNVFKQTKVKRKGSGYTFAKNQKNPTQPAVWNATSFSCLSATLLLSNQPSGRVVGHFQMEPRKWHMQFNDGRESDSLEPVGYVKGVSFNKVRVLSSPSPSPVS